MAKLVDQGLDIAAKDLKVKLKCADAAVALQIGKLPDSTRPVLIKHVATLEENGHEVPI